MKNNQLETILNFEGQEIKVITDKGKELFNLSNSCRVLGITTYGSNGNEKIRWKTKGVSEKLNKILECTDVHQENIKEINYILNEIEETDDRNSIYASRWLTSRLALECNNDKAKKYKNWLATLDESYSKGELTTNNPYLQLGNIADNMKLMSNMMNQIGQAFNGMQEYVQSSIQAKDLQIDQVKELIGFKNINTKRMVNEIKSKLSEKLGKKIYANHNDFQIIKHAIFKEFRTTTWENIPIEKYNSVYAFADELISEKYGKVY